MQHSCVLERESLSLASDGQIYLAATSTGFRIEMEQQDELGED